MRLRGGKHLQCAGIALLAVGAFYGLRPGLSDESTRGQRAVGVVDRVSQSDSAQPAHLAEIYGRLPLSFEANAGQSDPGVKFLSRGQGYVLFLTANEAVLRLGTTRPKSKVERQKGVDPVSRPAAFPGLIGRAAESENGLPAPNPEAQAPEVLCMRLIGANPRPRISGLDELPGRSNYFVGSDPKKWRTQVRNYAKVKYQGIYSGVDLVYYGSHGQLEYDFVVSPGTSPSRIGFEVGGASDLRVDADGDLRVKLEGGEVRLHRPVAYQPARAASRHVSSVPLLGSEDSGRTLVDARYVLEGENRVRFTVAGYDATKPLVIDPQLAYSTYLGGTNGDSGSGIAVDGSGNAYVIGYTFSTDFPTASPLQATNHGNSDTFVAKLNAVGSALVYSTYLGGSNADVSKGIAVDGSGNAYVTGYTLSTDFPTASPLQAKNHGGYDAFAFKLNAAGSALVYSTYLGGSGTDIAVGIAVDRSGNAYLTGYTFSTDFPTFAPLQTTNHGGVDVFVAKLNAAGSGLVYSTYLGGSNTDVGYGIAVDGSGNAYLTGYTLSTDFPTVTPLQSTNHGSTDAYVAKLNAAGSALVYSTYLGGTDSDAASGIKVDRSGNAYLVGYTFSTNFPTAKPLQSTNHGGWDAFVTKLNATGSALSYSTYLGGSGTEYGTGIAVDGSGYVDVTGRTNSTDFPTVTPLQGTNHGDYDVFVTKLKATGSGLVYSTYLGGSAGDSGNGVAVDRFGYVYVAGETNSTDFPTAAPLQGTYHGNADAFVAKILAGADLQITNSAPSSVATGSNITYTIVVTNLGPDAASNELISDATPVGTTFQSVSVSVGSCKSPVVGGTGTVKCTDPSLTAAGIITETLVVKVTAPSGSKITDTASTTSATIDPNTLNNTAKATTTVL